MRERRQDAALAVVICTQHQQHQYLIDTTSVSAQKIIDNTP